MPLRTTTRPVRKHQSPPAPQGRPWLSIGVFFSHQVNALPSPDRTPTPTWAAGPAAVARCPPAAAPERQRGLKASTEWWLGALYRPIHPERLATAAPAN